VALTTPVAPETIVAKPPKQVNQKTAEWRRERACQIGNAMVDERQAAPKARGCLS
jgi:hypothetical protein